MTKTISINQNNSDSTNSKKNSDSINAIFLIFSLIAVAMIIFSIDKFFDYEDYSKAAENCQEGSDELASIGIDSPALCTDIESEATKNMIESFISGSIGIGIMFIVITQQGPKAVSELDKKHSNPRNSDCSNTLTAFPASSETPQLNPLARDDLLIVVSISYRECIKLSSCKTKYR